eukprot:GHVU01064246.1.p1 GENE.GHVU01064246.1~~GHVU01064246.1.p1  ORF type:complete len:721 (-),score=174.66 GHVU01064246.1:68-2230(-)
MALSVREADAKRILWCFGLTTGETISINKETDLTKLSEQHPWLLQKKLAVKPDVLLKRRGKAGLNALNVTWTEAVEFLKEGIGKEVTQEGLRGVLSHFIVEPYFQHDVTTNEHYVLMRTLRDGDEILFATKGGVDVGEVEAHAARMLVPVRTVDEEIPDTIDFTELLKDIPAEASTKREGLQRFLQKLYTAFVRSHFAFLELNPIAFEESSGTVKILDSAAKLDHTADFVVEELTKSGPTEFPSPFGRIYTAAEQQIRDLDSKTGASLKLTVVNPMGKVWTMIAGGGASVVYSDTVFDLGYGAELANYGEYSGAPSEMTTYEYAKVIMKLVTAAGTERADGKVLLIGGGIANFTSVAETFRGIIRALREFRNELRTFGVRVFVRRGGPSYQEGLKLIRDVGEEIRLPIKVYGPETYMTAIIDMALRAPEEAAAAAAPEEPLKSSPSATTGASSSSKIEVAAGGGGGENKQKPDSVWHVTKMEDVEHRMSRTVDDVEARGSHASSSFEADAAAAARTLFSKDTQCFVWGLQTRAVQEMLDFDNVCGRTRHSVAAIVYEFGVSYLQPFYFGTEEIFVPVFRTLQEAVSQFPDVDTLINFASMRSSDKTTRQVMEFPSIKCIAIIAEGVPERFARSTMHASKEKDVTLIGPATVGGIRSGCFRIGNTGGRLENIMNSKLYRPGSVGIVTKSGGMLNEITNMASLYADGATEGVAIGGDRFPGG